MCRLPLFSSALLVSILCLSPFVAAGEPLPTAPRTVKALWSDFDPRSEPLDSQVVREWEKDGIIFRYVTYHIGTFKGVKARMAAFYGFPKGSGKVPGLLHLHGGGQRASLHEVEFYAKKGYACLSVNWGGREMEDSKSGDPNTDWGALDPTQQNVPGYFNLQPGEKYLDPFESPRNTLLFSLGVLSDLFGDVRVEDGVPRVKRASSKLLERLVCPQHCPGGAIGAVVGALQADVHGEIGQLLLGEFRRRSDAAAEWIGVCFHC